MSCKWLLLSQDNVIVYADVYCEYFSFEDSTAEGVDNPSTINITEDPEGVYTLLS